MMATPTKYTYTISTAFPNHVVASDRLTNEIQASAISIALDYINTAADECDIWLKDVLSGGDETILNGLVAAHSGEALVQPPSPVSLPGLMTATDGRLVVRNTTANQTKTFNLKCFNFKPGDSSSVENLDSDFNGIGDITATCYKADGTVTADPTLAVKTVLDWEPSNSYDIIGGWIDIPGTVTGGTPGEWYITIIGVPDVPAVYGGSVVFVSPVDLSLVTQARIVSDGRATQFMKHDATYHTNKLRLIVKHPASSTNPRLQMYLETFL
jgi:hypothetical protein